MISEGTQIIVYSFLNLLSLYTLDNAILIFLERNKIKNNLSRGVPYVIYFVVGVATYYLGDIPFLNTIISILLVLVMTFSFEGKIKIRFTIAFLWVLFGFVIEFSFSLIYINILNISFDEMLHNDLLKIIGNAYIAIISLIIIKLIQLIIKRKNASEKITYIDSFQISIIPFCSILILYAFLVNSLKNNTNNWITIVSIILIVFINVFFFYIFDKLKEVEKLKFENELHKSQSDYYIKLEENVNVSFDKIRNVKHDLKHHLMYLKTRTSENTVEALEEIDLKLDYLIGEVLSEEFLEYTKNIRLNKFLNYKVIQIKKHNIDFEVKTNVRESSNIDETSMYIILGNAIDNAIQNYNNVKSDEKKIKIKIIEESDNLLIRITNPYNKKLEFENEIPITSKNDKVMHGIGLKSIKKIVEDKNGYFKINTHNYIFSLEIVLFDEI